jgi:hypothetical protein
LIRPMNQSSQNNRKLWVLALSIPLAAALTACWAYRVSVLQGTAAYQGCSTLFIEVEGA